MLVSICFLVAMVLITLDNFLYGIELCYDRLIILDFNPLTYDYCINHCVMTCYTGNNDIDVITGHAKLGHIGQERINILEKGHLDSFS